MESVISPSFKKKKKKKIQLIPSIPICLETMIVPIKKRKHDRNSRLFLAIQFNKVRIPSLYSNPIFPHPLFSIKIRGKKKKKL